MLGLRVYFNYIEPHLPRPLHRALAHAWRGVRSCIKSALPAPLRDRLRRIGGRVGDRYFVWRTTPAVTAWLGPHWRRKGNIAEIDITYSCNLKCFNCNRSCEQDPSNDHMTVGQIRRFLEETRERGIQWRHIRLLGGEPTIHPDFLEIVGLVKAYRDRFFPQTRIVLVTNGYGAKVNEMLELVPAGIEIENSAKTSKVQAEFSTFNVAPVDVPELAGADFSNACRVVTSCGVGVTPYGYYPCAVAGAIDRTFGLYLGRSSLPDAQDPMTDELRTFCGLCGLFKPGAADCLDGPVTSATWQEAYARARTFRPTLGRLAESADLAPTRLGMKCRTVPDADATPVLR